MNLEPKNNTRNRFNNAPDYESGESIEHKLNNENQSLIGELSQSLKNIKIKSHMMKDKLVLSNKTTEEVEDIFKQSFKVMYEAMNQLGLILKTNSGIYCYLVIFVFIVLLCIFLHAMFS